MTFLEDLDDQLVELRWEAASRCTCWNDDTKQPGWDHQPCGGTGVLYAPAVIVRGLYRSRSEWRSRHMQGEHRLGEAQLTVPLNARPGYVDARVRDRYTVTHAVGDAEAGSTWLPAATAVPFLWMGEQEAWRVQLQGLDQSTRVKPAN
jgi:hypothetical protein